MNRIALAAAALAGAVAVGAVTGTELHAFGWDLRPDTGIARAVPTPAHTPRLSAHHPTSTVASRPAAASATGPTTLHLLDADQVGGTAGSWRRLPAGAKPAGRFQHASCQLSSLPKLGASSVTRRDFVGASRNSTDAAAGQLLATFPSHGAADRAYRVMRTWVGTCAASMRKRGYDTADVGPFRPVRSNSEQSGWWRGTFRPVNPGRPGIGTGAGWFAANGVALDGTAVTLVWINATGPEARHDTAATPITETLVNAARTASGG